jgi:hypothetical protein
VPERDREVSCGGYHRGRDELRLPSGIPGAVRGQRIHEPEASSRCRDVEPAVSCAQPLLGFSRGARQLVDQAVDCFLPGRSGYPDAPGAPACECRRQLDAGRSEQPDGDVGGHVLERLQQPVEGDGGHGVRLRDHDVAPAERAEPGRADDLLLELTDGPPDAFRVPQQDVVLVTCPEPQDGLVHRVDDLEVRREHDLNDPVDIGDCLQLGEVRGGQEEGSLARLAGSRTCHEGLREVGDGVPWTGSRAAANRLQVPG